MKRFIIQVLVASLAVVSVSAENNVDDEGTSNDPAVNERANACYDGAAWEGKCGDNEYLWQAGWYYVRLEAGIFKPEDIPAGFEWMIPPEDVEVSHHFSLCEAFYSFGPTYYVSFDSASGDIETDGDPYWIDDSSCSSVPASSLSDWTIAYAPNGLEQATTLCGSAPYRQQSANVYVCRGG